MIRMIRMIPPRSLMGAVAVAVADLLALLGVSCTTNPAPSALARQPLAPPQVAPIDFNRTWPKTALLHVGQTLRVVLPLRAGSPYSWHIESPLPLCLEVQSETVLSSLGAAPGVPHEQIMTFTATQAGEGDLEFFCARPREPKSAALEIRTTRVLVSAP